jgi:hypothetical protein
LFCGSSIFRVFFEVFAFSIFQPGKRMVAHLSTLGGFQTYRGTVLVPCSNNSFEGGFDLEMLSGLTPFRNVATQRCLFSETIGRPEVSPLRSSRTERDTSQLFTPPVDRDQTVSQRSKPNSRTTFIGEQPNPWNLLQLQDVMSRHRGAKRFRR